MTLTFIDRPVTAHYSVYPNRPITGIVLHDSESAGPLRVDQSQGSWHWLIDHDEDGTLYCDVSEAHAAWGVFATGHSAESLAKTKWRPPWLVRCPDDSVSDANYCAIHIEMVSYQGYRDAGIPYTRGQYMTLAALIRDIFARRGVLPIVGHGQVQTDRSDPVQFNWDAFHRLLAETSEEDDMSKVQELQAQIDQLNGITKTMQEQIDFKDELLQAANSRAGVAEAEVERLTALLTNTDLRTEDDIASVSLTRRGGAVQIIN
jgi:outer membrane murein-binding lipoprotein Lpp